MIMSMFEERRASKSKVKREDDHEPHFCISQPNMDRSLGQRSCKNLDLAMDKTSIKNVPEEED